MKFTAKDFKGVTLGHHGATPTIEQVAANIANAKLQAWLAEAPVVWGARTDDVYYTREEMSDEITHTAKLVCIEEIKTEGPRHPG